MFPSAASRVDWLTPCLLEVVIAQAFCRLACERLVEPRHRAGRSPCLTGVISLIAVVPFLILLSHIPSVSFILASSPSLWPHAPLPLLFLTLLLHSFRHLLDPPPLPPPHFFFFFSLFLAPFLSSSPISQVSPVPPRISPPFPSFPPLRIVTRDYQILNSGSSLKTIGSDVVITAARGVPGGLRSPEELDKLL